MTATTTSTTPNTDILARMDALQMKLTGLAAIEATLAQLTVCQQCQQPLRHYPQGNYWFGECTDENCRRHGLTRELHTLAALSETLVDEYLAAKSV